MKTRESLYKDKKVLLKAFIRACDTLQLDLDERDELIYFAYEVLQEEKKWAYENKLYHQLHS